jgi:hypothetical protein
MIVVARGTLKRTRDMASCDVGSKEKGTNNATGGVEKRKPADEQYIWEQKNQNRA